MSIKMAQLMKETGETRSTLLFYVKEGLLQEPTKPKPNVHLYHDDSIERVRLIKMLQNQLHYSIQQIKQVFDDNRFDFENGVEGVLQKLELFSGMTERQYKTMDDALKVYDLDKESIEYYIKENILELENGYFNDSSWKVLQILNDLEKYTQEKELLLLYVKTAKELAVKEFDLGRKLVEQDNTNHAQELFLDLILTLKPYIFNLQTKNEHKKRATNE
ncbi:MerR family transcriptional regulator [Sulfurimonas sp.]|uniref:MerR family transcriptional regulator n=1 Tax=Sulfurimonas sp. TaxID=2022749 RepID=UPI003D12E575